MNSPADLTLGIAGMCGLSVAAFTGGWLIGGHASRWLRTIISIATVLLLATYARWLYDSVLLTKVVPIADVLLWGNLQLPAAALLGGIAASSLKTPRWQRATLAIALLSIGVWREFDPLIGTTPALGPARWTGNVCRQSTKSTCSAASAATLLDAHGIHVTEADMVSACLTHVTGTTDLGIYRGLKIETAHTPWTVVAAQRSVDTLDRWPLPALVNIGLRGTGGILFEHGGVHHSIVVLGLLPDGRLDIADPFAGRQTWTRNQFADAYTGSTFALVARSKIR